MKRSNDCLWLNRVSALIDRELPAEQADMVFAHASSCGQCRNLLNFHNSYEMTSTITTVPYLPELPSFITRSRFLRCVIGVLGVALVVIALVNFVRGSGSEAGLHDLRHLGIWQASLGVAVVVLAISFRLSLFVVSIVISFFVLTTAATVFDMLKGHSGPWADFTHLVELVVLLCLMLLALPRLRLWVYARRSRRLSHHTVK